MSSPPDQRSVARDREPWGDRAQYAPTQIGSKRALAAEAPWRLGTDARFPDTVLDAGQVGDIAVRAAATRGPSHRFYGTTREDAAAVVSIEGRFVAAAVADGVGTVDGSDLAAHSAVRTCLRHLHQGLASRAELDRECLVSAFDGVQMELLRHRDLGGRPATTLTAAVVAATPAPDGRYERCVARVGDSPAYTLAAGEFQEVFPTPEAGADGVHTTVTEGLPVPLSRLDALALEPGWLEPGQALALATDGLGTPLRFDDVRAYLADAWRVPGPDALEFLTELQFRRRSYDDDRSAVVLWAPPPGGAHGDRSWQFPTDVRFLRDGMLLHDAVLDAGRAGELEIRLASTRGDHRRRSGSARHQAAGAVAAGDSRVVAALAEGIRGPGTFHLGCQYAVERVLQELRSLGPDDPVGAELVRAVLDVERGLSMYGAAGPDKTTTLVVAVVNVPPAPGGGNAFTVVRIGGSPAYRLSPIECRPLFDAADPATAIALAEPQPPTVATIRQRSGHLHLGEVLVLASNSLAADLGGDLGGALQRAVPGPTEFVQLLQHHRPGGDDRSAVAVWAPRGDR